MQLVDWYGTAGGSSPKTTWVVCYAADACANSSEWPSRFAP